MTGAVKQVSALLFSVTAFALMVALFTKTELETWMVLAWSIAIIGLGDAAFFTANQRNRPIVVLTATIVLGWLLTETPGLVSPTARLVIDIVAAVILTNVALTFMFGARSTA